MCENGSIITGFNRYTSVFFVLFPIFVHIIS